MKLRGTAHGTAAARQAVVTVPENRKQFLGLARGTPGTAKIKKIFALGTRPAPPGEGRDKKFFKTAVPAVPGVLSDAGHRVRRHGGGTDGTPAAPTPPAPTDLAVAPRVARDGRPRPGSSTPQGPAPRCPSGPAGAPWLVPLGTLQGVPGYSLSRRFGLTGKE